jgi:hypothetical protein
MVRRCLAYAVVVVSVASHSSVGAEPRAVIELFTSQGCSSCPPADRLLGQLAADPSLVAISVPIDYWDYLGWKDSLADPRNSARQKGYARTRGDGQVYTPQAVVNGALHALGSDRAAIERAIAESRKLGAALSLPVRLAIADGAIKVTLPDGMAAIASIGGVAARASVDVWMCGLARAVTVAIGRGENKGRTVTYHNVVRRWMKVGEWAGTGHSWSVPVQKLKGDGIDAAAILVQSGSLEKPRAIIGATLASIH